MSSLPKEGISRLPEKVSLVFYIPVDQLFNKSPGNTVNLIVPPLAFLGSRKFLNL